MYHTCVVTDDSRCSELGDFFANSGRVGGMARCYDGSDMLAFPKIRGISGHLGSAWHKKFKKFVVVIWLGGSGGPDMTVETPRVTLFSLFNTSVLYGFPVYGGGVNSRNALVMIEIWIARCFCVKNNPLFCHQLCFKGGMFLCAFARARVFLFLS